MNINPKDMLSKFIEELRRKYNIGLYPDTIEKVCNEVALESEQLAYKNNLIYDYISFEKIGIEEPVHYASLIGYPQNNNIKWYIIDPTYGQFFENKKFKEFMLEKYNDFSIRLLEDGYIDFTLPNFYRYMNGFLFSKAFTKNINVDQVIRNAEELLKRNNIIEREKKL